MKNVFLISTVIVLVLGLSMPSYATCKDDVRGGWKCFPADKTSTGTCKDMKCAEGCVETVNGQHGHCCSKPKGTSCSGNVYVEGCLRKLYVECLPTQYCDKKGICQNKEDIVAP